MDLSGTPLEVLLLERGRLLRLIELIEASEAASNKPYFECSTEEAVDGLRNRVTELDDILAEAGEPKI